MGARDVGQVPAATRAMRVLRFLAASRERVSLETDRARSAADQLYGYHLLAVLIEEGFVAHRRRDRYGSEWPAFEGAAGFSRQEPLPQRIAGAR